MNEQPKIPRKHKTRRPRRLAKVVLSVAIGFAGLIGMVSAVSAEPSDDGPSLNYPEDWGFWYSGFAPPGHVVATRHTTDEVTNVIRTGCAAELLDNHPPSSQGVSVAVMDCVKETLSNVYQLYSPALNRFERELLTAITYPHSLHVLATNLRLLAEGLVDGCLGTTFHDNIGGVNVPLWAVITAEEYCVVGAP